MEWIRANETSFSCRQIEHSGTVALRWPAKRAAAQNPAQAQVNPFDDEQEDLDRRSTIRSPSGGKPRRPHKPKKRPIELPRQGDLHTTIRVVELAELSAKETSVEIGVSAEIIRYHRTNARILHLLDAQGRITAEGRALLASRLLASGRRARPNMARWCKEGLTPAPAPA